MVFHSEVARVNDNCYIVVSIYGMFSAETFQCKFFSIQATGFNSVMPFQNNSVTLTLQTVVTRGYFNLLVNHLTW